MFKSYLKTVGLSDLTVHADEFELNNFVAEVFASNFPDLSEDEMKKLYIYDVPWVSPNGPSCILDKKADKPYNLAETFGLDFDWKNLKSHPQTIRLWRLNKVVNEIYKLTKVEWFGIYRKVDRRILDSRLRGNDKDDGSFLVKEAYKGVFSRAEFPLTSEFAKKSNNSTVGLSGRAIVVQDVAAHAGPYYECDGKVNSEFCLPILDKNNKVIGIIDAEAFAKNHYTKERLLQIAKVAYDLSLVNLGV